MTSHTSLIDIINCCLNNRRSVIGETRYIGERSRVVLFRPLNNPDGCMTEITLDTEQSPADNYAACRWAVRACDPHYCTT